MDAIESEKLSFSKVDQIGVIVRDMDKAIEYYQSLGIGPFEPLKHQGYIERKVLGKPVNVDDIKKTVRAAQMGPIQFELIEPGEGESLWREFLDTRGEGINHLGFFVDDIDKETAKLEKKGFNALYSSRFRNGGGAAYFDIDRIGGVMFELIQWPP